jgi:phosphotransferase system  glucose/maltose/N-acetylglucosamine-specific IIC component
MSDHGALFVVIFLGFPVLLVATIWFVAISPMQQCIKQGYDWIDKDCVDRD